MALQINVLPRKDWALVLNSAPSSYHKCIYEVPNAGNVWERWKQVRIHEASLLTCLYSRDWWVWKTMLSWCWILCTLKTSLGVQEQSWIKEVCNMTLCLTSGEWRPQSLLTPQWHCRVCCSWEGKQPVSLQGSVSQLLYKQTFKHEIKTHKSLISIWVLYKNKSSV